MKQRPLKNTSRIPLRECKSPEARCVMLRAHGHDGYLPGFRMMDDAADGMIENAVGAFPVPLGVATNFVVNGEERLVAMATEERSVIAAASYAAKLCRETGGFTVDVGPNAASGQVLFAGFIPDERNMTNFEHRVKTRLREFAERLSGADDPMRKHGGGLLPESITATVPHGDRRDLLVITFEVDVADAMGANVVTRIGEALASHCEHLAGVRRTAVICTNDAQGPAVTATARWTGAACGPGIARRIIDLQAWAEADRRRAVTHNKGVMNGVSAVALATGQDVRAVEASAHAAATEIARSTSRYAPLTAYRAVDDGVEGRLFLRVPLGTVGGATAHPTAEWCRKLMGVRNARDLAAICGAAGLAQNFAALRSLADEGIPEAHARLRGNRP